MLSTAIIAQTLLILSNDYLRSIATCHLSEVIPELILFQRSSITIRGIAT